MPQAEIHFPSELAEFSVVFTDRSLNHMSSAFQTAFRDIHRGLCAAYNAAHAVVVPGGGTFAMEAVARQFGRDADVLVVRNGWFSYRWTQIFEATGDAASVDVMTARPMDNATAQPRYAPPPVDEVVARIRETQPDVVFAPHVETSAGIMLPDDYVAALADAAHGVGALMVLDCVASGCVWVDMQATGVDVLISAPQKGWSSTPCAGLVMLSDRAVERLGQTTSDSFAVDLAKWSGIMRAYLDGGHAYHATLPTDSLVQFRDALHETRDFGFEAARAAQLGLGRRVRAMLGAKGLTSLAAPGFEAMGVVVYHAPGREVQSGRAFAAEGVQIAAGVPLQVGEPDGFSTFRIGLFGLDKLRDVDGTVRRLAPVLDKVFG
ncbi:aminotransferase class V-fold PLP-dependent enzyme [Jannaschia sp. LMIT008]|uniref:aminotransferase class V-fold PLP-dependent enzyme n=1 Tax=Jannaschia maritima TaxID=3032585 RepID=UPI0028120345|nr:aminotransferase class V-fold PLP-dependent enzyme [Jannaschia sp. LMIT008]